MRKQLIDILKQTSNNCIEKTVTNIDNNTVLQVKVDNNEITLKDTSRHQNKDNDQEKM